jgi:dienelactone hydrolase/DNA-directed RNA polymerase subunit RPC12/RpoP
MSIHFRCVHCGRKYSAGDNRAGKPMRCQKCGRRIMIPDLGEGESDVYEFTHPLPSDTELEVFEGARDPGVEQLTGVGPLPKRAKPRPPRVKRSGRWWTTRQAVTGLLAAAALVGGGVLAYRYWPRSRIWITTTTAEGKHFSAAFKLPKFFEPGSRIEIEPDVLVQVVPLPGGALPGHSGKLWLYLPRGEHAPGSLPCILMAASGTKTADRTTLSDGDRPHHVPFVRAGFAVLAYEVDGVLRSRITDIHAEPMADARKFLGGYAGLVNAKIALEYLLVKVPQVDPGRLFAAGHGLAGTTAILFAENEPRLKGCAALAAPIDLEAWFGAPVVAEFRQGGFGDLVSLASPRNNEERLNCPVFLFHARDDSVVPVEQSQECAERLERQSKRVTLEIVPRGGHGERMMAQGIPRVIDWIRGLAGSHP